MLRDILCQFQDVGTWPCDEINYIWRYGNAQYLHDEFSADMATRAIKDYIRSTFDRLAAKHQLSYVVEKTCANSLRVPFLDRVIPDAKYVFIIRDGRDVVTSAMKRWQASLDFMYIMKKARYVPLRDVPYYAMRYLGNRIYLILSHQKRLAFWGPRFEGMKEALQQYSIPEVCAIQWARSVDRAATAFALISADRVCQVKYEQLVAQPVAEMSRVADFLEIKTSEGELRHSSEPISASSVGRWKQELDDRTLAQVRFWMEATMRCHGYDW